jgi:acetoin utilization deacetylase AcuC-like enzyme
VSSAITAGRDEPGTVVMYWNDDCLRHDTGAGLFEVGPHPWLALSEAHPETPARLLNIRSVLTSAPIASQLSWATPVPAEVAELELFHTTAHIGRVHELCNGPGVNHVVGPTYVGPGSWPAILAAAGCALAAAAAAASAGGIHYCLIRPPGHHAAPDRADGYCLVNNAALAVRRAQQLGVARIAVIDIDAHHGNGTQAGFYSDPNVLTISVHMNHQHWGDGEHPEDGTMAEQGAGPGLGANLNIALPYGSGDKAYEAIFQQVIAPAVIRFGPELIVLVSGQDANQFDPNGRMCLTMQGYHTIGAMIRDLLASLGGAPLVATQEGGYAPTYIGFCVLGLITGLLGTPIGCADPLAFLPDWPNGVDDVIASVRSHPLLSEVERADG